MSAPSSRFRRQRRSIRIRSRLHPACNRTPTLTRRRKRRLVRMDDLGTRRRSRERLFDVPEMSDVLLGTSFARVCSRSNPKPERNETPRSTQIAAKLLTSLELESRIDVRRTYGRQLIPLFRLLDVGVVRWLANFVRILSAQLQYADSFWIDVLESLLVVFELAGIDAVRNSGQRRIGRGVQVPGPSDHVRQLRLEVGSVKSPSGFPTAGGGDFQLGTSGPKTSPVKDIVVARVSPTKSDPQSSPPSNKDYRRSVVSLSDNATGGGAGTSVAGSAHSIGGGLDRDHRHGP